MNIKHILLVPGAIALALSCLPINPVSAQVEGAPVQQQQMRGKRGGGMKGLDLTEAQKAEMQKIRQETEAAILNVLTPEQQAKWQSFKQSRGQAAGQARGQKGDKMQALGLTEAQKTQMRQIRENAKERMMAILTPEQRTSLEQKRQGMQERRSQFRQQRQQGQQPQQQ